ncbi:MAG TPA: helix-turn-helix domain-containing protein [Gemmatimonadales bacterium]|nr:helix-turn-helix domain-containing protein [Gemmatimonadales bacterium]
MSDIPDISPIAHLMGDRARAAMLAALVPGQALTATELARMAAVSKQTASSHLAKLQHAKLVHVERQGRHRYFRLADHDVATAIEHLSALAERIGAGRVRTGPADPAMRKARVCYDHLAGELGVFVYDRLRARGLVRKKHDALALTDAGERFLTDFGVDVEALRRGRRPLVLACLDWSVRRHHLAGAVGAALLQRCFDLKWARREKQSRVVVFSAIGERGMRERFGR